MKQTGECRRAEPVARETSLPSRGVLSDLIEGQTPSARTRRVNKLASSAGSPVCLERACPVVAAGTSQVGKCGINADLRGCPALWQPRTNTAQKIGRIGLIRLLAHLLGVAEKTRDDMDRTQSVVVVGHSQRVQGMLRAKR